MPCRGGRSLHVPRPSSPVASLFSNGHLTRKWLPSLLPPPTNSRATCPLQTLATVSRHCVDETERPSGASHSTAKREKRTPLATPFERQVVRLCCRSDRNTSARRRRRTRRTDAPRALKQKQSIARKRRTFEHIRLICYLKRPLPASSRCCCCCFKSRMTSCVGLLDH